MVRLRRVRDFLAAAAVLASMSHGDLALAQQRETISVESRSHGKPLTIKAQVVLPANRGDDKIPAMIIVHGSGGVREAREFAYVREFNALGVAGIVIDSFTARGIKSTVRDQSPVSSYDMVVDAVSTLKAVAMRPEIDPARIGIIGFSKGGTVTIKAALRHYMAPLTGDDAKFALLIAMYPWCGDLPLDFHTAGNVQLHMLLGERDTYAGTESCKEFGKRYADAGGNVALKVYAGAQHDWDFPGPRIGPLQRGRMAANVFTTRFHPGPGRAGSKIKVMENNKRAATAKAATAHCTTLGVSGGYSAQTRAQSMQDVRRFVREAFKLQ